MTIRRVDKTTTGAVSNKKSRETEASGENFAQLLEGVAAMRGGNPVDAVGSVTPVGDEGGQKRQQLDRAGELLDSLEEIGRELTARPGERESEMRSRLRQTRDEALRTLNDSATTSRGEERELLHRTAVMATVELAKSDRGDYN
ncbi:MAG: hypothetical protein HQL54_00590 [Magnetococcales bacterium]|nr:hypothetical protein [Magnetococcales bacterium]